MQLQHLSKVLSILWQKSSIHSFYYVLYSLSENVQNFQSAGFQFYDSMAFILPSMAHGHSAFQGTASNHANSTSVNLNEEEEEDLQCMYAL